jgi:hypothetical protein
VYTRKKFSQRLCDVKGCGGRHIARGLCHKHYKRWQLHGDCRMVSWTVTYLKLADTEGLTQHLLASKTINSDGCWEWNRSRTHKGYGKQVMSGKLYAAHRLSAYVFLGLDLTSKKHVCHKCDNPPCINPEHLYVGTVVTNMNDRSVRGRHGLAKLTPEAVVEIRERLVNGESQSSIARQFSISQAIISKIYRKQLWKHIM